MSVIPVFGRWRWEDHEFEVGMSYTEIEPVDWCPCED
jgi:hypothetical protein